MEANQMAHSSYRKYKKEIVQHAPFLVNRPTSMVKHCMTRISHAYHSDKTGIIAVGELNLIAVVYFK